MNLFSLNNSCLYAKLFSGFKTAFHRFRFQETQINLKLTKELVSRFWPTMKKEAADFSESLILFYKTTRLKSQWF
jgi:hypothetical protein